MRPPLARVPAERRTDALEATEELVQVPLRTSLSLQDLYVSLAPMDRVLVDLRAAAAFAKAKDSVLTSCT